MAVLLLGLVLLYGVRVGPHRGLGVQPLARLA
jgi:hypothetical protein